MNQNYKFNVCNNQLFLAFVNFHWVTSMAQPLLPFSSINVTPLSLSKSRILSASSNLRARLALFLASTNLFTVVSSRSRSKAVLCCNSEIVVFFFPEPGIILQWLRPGRFGFRLLPSNVSMRRERAAMRSFVSSKRSHTCLSYPSNVFPNSV